LEHRAHGAVQNEDAFAGDGLEWMHGPSFVALMQKDCREIA
jgi:hypothetical protein